jgi:tRNA 5-methylaminomethyl-2-thiouridine biosynthesis bifunctional protein
VPTQGRVSVRATTQDHMPMVGALANKSDFLSAYERLKHGDRRFKYSQATYHPGLYVSLGHGSHGLSTAMLSAEIIACLAAGEPLPVSSDLYHAIHPSRFWLRQL